MSRRLAMIRRKRNGLKLSLQPVPEPLEIARKLYPELKRLSQRFAVPALSQALLLKEQVNEVGS